MPTTEQINTTVTHCPLCQKPTFFHTKDFVTFCMNGPPHDNARLYHAHFIMVYGNLDPSQDFVTFHMKNIGTLAYKHVWRNSNQSEIRLFLDSLPDPFLLEHRTVSFSCSAPKEPLLAITMMQDILTTFQTNLLFL